VTGAGGFAGGHLLRYLSESTDWKLFGCYRTPSDISTIAGVEPVVADLTIPAQVDTIVDRTKPDFVFHLAALSSPHQSFTRPLTVLSNNLSAQVNLLEALRTLCPKARILVVGSGDEYGMVQPEDLPLREDAPLRPTSPYSVSKIGQDFLGLQYHLAYGLPIVRLRPFNHIGPGQDDTFVVASFARQIAEIEAGLREPVILVGNLQAQRDFTDVRDIVRAYYLAILHCQPGEVYNVGSGVARSIGQVLDTLVAQSGVSVTVKTDPSRLRPADVPRVVADPTKFRLATGWSPSISFEQSLRDTLNYWRNRVRREVEG
jgi:GDP-4-dehydro-6-deoxy-D-mannose reductase